MIASALRDATNNPDITVEESMTWDELRYFFDTVRDEPWKFPVTGKMATSIRKLTRRAKGAAQPQGRKNKRKARQESRIRTHKERRKYRRQIAESYNAAVEQMEKENAEIEAIQAEIQERIARQPKFRIMAGDGTVLMSGIPAEFVVSEETEENLLPKVIVPGS